MEITNTKLSSFEIEALPNYDSDKIYQFLKSSIKLFSLF